MNQVNFNGLSKYCSLYELDLNSNLIKNIDLSPLSLIKSLQIVDIGYNKIVSIDLNQLFGSNIHELYLSYNEVTNIDFSPLHSGRINLKYLSLDGNPLNDQNIRSQYQLLANLERNNTLKVILKRY